MTHFLAPVVASAVPCKCCGTTTALFGVVDFHKNCEARRREVLGLSGIPIYYHRCPDCRFVFTTAFDQFTPDDFRHHIYNQQYALVDPDYELIRPRGNSAYLKKLLAKFKPAGILDYGGGNGKLVDLLKNTGFSQAETYDPFVPAHATKPKRRYDLIVSFKVVEHSPDPISTFREMIELLAEPGLILFSTLLQPADIDRQGLGWWYAGPRNGHVSLFTKASLEAIGKKLGLTYYSISQNLHTFHRVLPEYAKDLVRVR